MRELHEKFALVDPNLTRLDDVFTSATVAMVEAFQRSRGLAITGEVDALTWSQLLEAGWRLGQRLLFVSRSYLRGDDVADLQVRLAQLGFNPGRIDGIFGPLSADALAEFQRNCGIAGSATLTRRTFVELQRLAPTSTSRSLVTEARDLAGFNDHASGPVVLCGEGSLYDALVEGHRFGDQVLALGALSTEEVATIANERRAALVLSFDQTNQLQPVRFSYWASYTSYSRQGEFVATSIANTLALASVAPRSEVTGMALPVLRETKMTTVHVQHGQHDQEAIAAVVTAILSTVEKVIHRQA